MKTLVRKSVHYKNVTSSKRKAVSIDRGFGSRGIVCGGRVDSPTAYGSRMDYFTIATPMTSLDFGDLITPKGYTACVSDGSRGVIGAGYNDPTRYSHMDYITISSREVKAGNFGEYLEDSMSIGAADDGSRGVWCGGSPSGETSVIHYITIATPSNSTHFGYLTVAKSGTCGTSDGSRAVLMSGSGPGSLLNEIDYFTIQTPSNASDFGNLILGRTYGAATGDGSRAIIGGRYPTNVDIEYITISTPSGGSAFGALSVARYNLCAVSDGFRGVFCGGDGDGDKCDYVNIDGQTGLTAVDFGNMGVTHTAGPGGLSGD